MGDPDCDNSVVLSCHPILEGNLVWKFMFPNKLMKDLWLLEEIVDIIPTFTLYVNGILEKVDLCLVVGDRLHTMVTEFVKSWSFHKVAGARTGWLICPWFVWFGAV